MSATTAAPTPEQMQRAKWDLILADIEYRQEQLRGPRQDIAWKPWQIVATVVTAAAAFMGAGFALAKLLA
jgi:hypothetical protein